MRGDKKMANLKYFLYKKKMLIISISLIFLCSLAIAVVVYVQITNQNQKEYVEGEFNYAQLENDFQNIFTNTINKEATANLNINYDDILYCA